MLNDRKEDRVDSKELVMGKTKVFYRNNARVALQALRDKALGAVARTVQRRYTLYRLRKRYKTLLSCYRECQAAVKLRTAGRCNPPSLPACSSSLLLLLQCLFMTLVSRDVM